MEEYILRVLQNTMCSNVCEEYEASRTSGHYVLRYDIEIRHFAIKRTRSPYWENIKYMNSFHRKTST
jgi:hypothetical protein